MSTTKKKTTGAAAPRGKAAGAANAKGGKRATACVEQLVERIPLSKCLPRDKVLPASALLPGADPYA